METKEIKQLKVSKISDVKKVAMSIFHTLKEGYDIIEIKIIGAAALNQAMKAIAKSKETLAPIGITCLLDVNFFNGDVNGEIKSGLKITVYRR